MTPELKGFLLLAVVKILSVFTAINIGVMMVIWLERRLSAFIQDRRGPNRVGPFGLLQSVADGIKNIAKEETLPAQANRTLFMLAPALSFIPAMLAFAVIPFAAPLPLSFDFTLPIIGQVTHDGVVPMVIADLPVGFLFILATTSMAVYGIVLAGWASNSKYAFLGSMRASAQMVSYEIALGLSVIAILIVAGNVTLSEIIATQQDSLWFVFPLTVAYGLFLVSAFAETNRLPFDLPEAEAELVTGYHTEYSSMKFSMFFIAEYTSIITMSALIATLFFGGWDIPFTSWDQGEPSVLVTLATHVSFVVKTMIFVGLYIWVRWTLPRFRFDQLMQLGWKVLFPVALGYIAIVGAVVLALEAAGMTMDWKYALILFAVNLVFMVGFFAIYDRGTIVAGAAQSAEGVR